MSNTQVRIISALVLMSMVYGLYLLGSEVAAAASLLVGILLIDEVNVNFIKLERKSLFYLCNQLILIVPFILIIYVFKLNLLLNIFLYFAMALNIILLGYLFYTDITSAKFKGLLQEKYYISAIYFLSMFLVLGILLSHEKWFQLVAVLFCISFGMDTGAWFFGKNFGKHKLWPSVSPKKTVEGLIGGSITSGVLGGIVWNIFFNSMGVFIFFSFCMLGVMSQLGDLIQSKIKRQFSLKDSSSIIPGHGGIYDRIDGLIFLAPFYMSILKNFYF